MDSNENSILFSLTHLRRLSAMPVSTGGILATTGPTGHAPYIPLGVMAPTLLAPRRAWKAGWLVPTLAALGGLLIVLVGVLLVLLLSPPASVPVVVAAQAPAVLPSGPAAEPTAVATPLSEGAAGLPSAVESSREPEPAAAPAPAKRKEPKVAKLGKRKRGKAIRRGGGKSARAIASRTTRPRRSTRVRRTELDDIIDATLQ